MAKLSRIIFIIFWIVLVYPASASNFVLVIDPGHGGKDTGALGRKGREKDINLAVATLAGQYIKNEHPEVKIIFTRTRDIFIGLNERADIANKANANLFISIHSNALRKKSPIKGAEVYTFGVTRIEENLEVAQRENSVILLEDDYEQKYEGYDPNSAESSIIFEFMVNVFADQSINFASMVEKELVKTADRVGRGVRQAGYLVLRKSAMPSILIELDYISNQESENYLLSQLGQKNLARAICNAFTKYKREFDRKSNNSATENTTAKILTEPTPLSVFAEQIPEQSVSSGRIYKIQILASTKKISNNSPELKGYTAGYFVEGKYYKYTYGESADWDEINHLRQKISKDFKNAFIIAFENGVKITIN